LLYLRPKKKKKALDADPNDIAAATAANARRVFDPSSVA
jgi:hypothetical protein